MTTALSLLRSRAKQWVEKAPATKLLLLPPEVLGLADGAKRRRTKNYAVEKAA